MSADLRMRALILAALALIAISIVWLFGVGTPGMANLPLPFDSQRWKVAGYRADTRCSMVMDLKHRIGLVGRTRGDVLKLLGEPDQTKDGFPIGYLLCPSFADIFILRLDWAGGRVISAQVGDT